MAKDSLQELGTSVVGDCGAKVTGQEPDDGDYANIDHGDADSDYYVADVIDFADLLTMDLSTMVSMVVGSTS